MSVQEVELETCIKTQVEEDVQSTDLIWSLFVAALHSYRFDTVLRPFPSAFVDENGEKQVKILESIVDKTPRLQDVACNGRSVDTNALELLKWVIDRQNFSLKSLPTIEFDSLKNMTGDTSTKMTLPDFIFEVIPNETATSRFEELRGGRKTMFAYHGSRLENFYSILHNGLASHMNKISVFGEGTYLSSELSVSINYSPTGLGWKNSCLGKKLSCVAVCEMIDDVSVKCTEKLDGQENGNSVRRRSRAANSMAGDVPEKYYVVQNNEMLRVKYLLVYAEKTSPPRQLSWHSSWFYRHRFAVMLIGYILVLVCVGLANSKTFKYQMKRFWKSRTT